MGLILLSIASHEVNTWYVFLAMMGVCVPHGLWVQNETVETIPCSRFET
ncbi:MAG: hypothetical protein WCZ18_03290 [Ottowia sp.]